LRGYRQPSGIVSEGIRGTGNAMKNLFRVPEGNWQSFAISIRGYWHFLQMTNISQRVANILYSWTGGYWRILNTP
jgi:hypothetical protein